MKHGSTRHYDGGRVQVAEEFVPVIERLGLASLEGVRAYDGDLVKNHHGRRDIFRITTTDGHGQPLVLFLKRIRHAYKKDGVRSFLKHGRVWSISRDEWENSCLLINAGVPVSGLVAYGEDCSLLWERFSFIITKCAPGRTVDEFLRTERDRGVRRRVFNALARQMRAMHDAGLTTPDIFARHVFVELTNGQPAFWLIDMARVGRGRGIGPRAHDLAALNASAPMRFVTARERVRFLRVYAGKRDKRLFRLVRQRTEHLMGRRKFVDFKAT